MYFGKNDLFPKICKHSLIFMLMQSARCNFIISWSISRRRTRFFYVQSCNCASFCVLIEKPIPLSPFRPELWSPSIEFALLLQLYTFFAPLTSYHESERVSCLHTEILGLTNLFSVKRPTYTHLPKMKRIRPDSSPRVLPDLKVWWRSCGAFSRYSQKKIDPGEVTYNKRAQWWWN